MSETGLPQDGLMRDTGWTRRKLLRSGLVLGLVGAGATGALLGACSPPAPVAGPASSATAAPAKPAAAGATAPAAPAAAPTAAGAPRSGGTLVAGWEEDAANLDPTKILCAHESRIAELYSDTLWEQFGDSTDAKPGLATRWEPSADGLTWDITLRQGVKFQDGTAVDADAIKWNFDRWLDPQHPFYDGPYGLLSYYLGAIQGVEKTGDTSVRISLSKLDATFTSNMLVPYTAPVSPASVQKMGKQQAGITPVATGAFQVTEWQKGVRIVLKRNDAYWGDKAYLDQIIIKPIVENAQRLSQLQSGDADLVVAMSPEFIPAIQADPKLQLLQSPGMHIWWIALNMHEEPMKKKEVRQALNYAVNKAAIVNQILRGAAAVTPGPMLPNSFGTDPSIKPYPFDPQKAKDLLAAAGYPNGFTTRFWVPESGSGMIAPKEIAQVVQANLKDVGVQADIVTQEWTSYVHDWGQTGLDKDGKPFYGMAEMSWNFTDPDPAFWLNPNVRTDAQAPKAFNGSFYSNAQVDDLLTKASGTIDKDARSGYFQQAQKIMVDDCPWIFTFSANNIAAASQRVKGVVLNPCPSLIRLNTAYLTA
jgi:peptide/nickel transport system substrate-binding protein